MSSPIYISQKNTFDGGALETSAAISVTWKSRIRQESSICAEQQKLYKPEPTSLRLHPSTPGRVQVQILERDQAYRPQKWSKALSRSPSWLRDEWAWEGGALFGQSTSWVTRRYTIWCALRSQPGERVHTQENLVSVVATHCICDSTLFSIMWFHAFQLCWLIALLLPLVFCKGNIFRHDHSTHQWNE